MAGKIIGELIADEVYRQKWNIDEFAGKICCTRQNVYHLFKRNSIDVVQLQLISKVLNHNFFLDLANNPELAGANDPEVEKEMGDTALLVHNAMCLKTYSRCDFILDKKGQLYFLEVNTLPGMTPTQQGQYRML